MKDTVYYSVAMLDDLCFTLYSALSNPQANTSTHQIAKNCLNPCTPIRLCFAVVIKFKSIWKPAFRMV